MVTKGVPVPRRASAAVEPLRTCIGCGRRDTRSALLRVVTEVAPDGSFRAVVDPARVRSGRGASLHTDPRCLAVAVKRRAFGRALRVEGAVDVSEVSALLHQS